MERMTTPQTFISRVGRNLLDRLSASPVQVLVGGVLLALLVTVLVTNWLMNPPLSEIVTLVQTLAITSFLSLGVGFWLYRRGWTRSPSLSLTLIATYVIAAILTWVNVWVMARLMFASPHDLALALVLLIFAGIIATTFGIFVAASVTDGLRQLAGAARRLAQGNLSARAVVNGRDEVGQVAHSFNIMAAQLEETARQREELEAMRRDLIAWVSHDLRTPLTSIRALVEALSDGVVTDPETVQRYYRTIRADVLSLNSLINDLFELAQLDAGLELEKSLHSFTDLISDALESFRGLSMVKNVQIVGTVSQNLDPVPLNAPKIGRVLSNLLGNAIKYTPSGGRVEVTAQRVGAAVRVTVMDSGPGFAEADLPRVFEKFYRGEQARSRATGGAGLGLAIARRIVEAHNGRIWAENGPDGGALVGFDLPA
ncbi:MAG: HAMP domain-containing sensor histidine kinase [Candidatus Promineifilaceae bacterium]